MELRHLRYFVAVVEAGSLTEAAEKKLHTSQPSLSRQIRDLEYQVGTELLTRTASGVVPTAAGRRADRGGSPLSQSCEARMGTGRCGTGGRPPRRAAGQTHVRDGLPDG